MEARLEQTIRDAYQRGRNAHSGIAIDEASFRRYASERLADLAPKAQIRAEDLYLACACLGGTSAAIAELERSIFDSIRPAIAAVTDQVDEVLQRVRTHLLVGRKGRKPALESYSGTGPLWSWVRIVSVREAYKLVGAGKKTVAVADETLFDLLDTAAADPHLEALKTSYRQDVRLAFLDAVADLTRRQRATLRMSVLDGLTIDEIAPVYDVHRSTVARWLQSARDLLLAGTKRHLERRLQITGGEAESVLRLVHSRLDVSLSNVLRTCG